jgi:hypothetical protein
MNSAESLENTGALLIAIEQFSGEPDFYRR